MSLKRIIPRLPIILLLTFTLAGCSIDNHNDEQADRTKQGSQVEQADQTEQGSQVEQADYGNGEESTFEYKMDEEVDSNEEEDSKVSEENTSSALNFKDIPPYDGRLSVEINDNKPFFTEDELTTETFETYSELDSLGRCGVAYANVCKELMPTEKRGNISGIHPSGWVQNKYPGIVDSQPPYLYNRCHLIGYKLAGENANEKNLITGTRYFNAEGMLPFEDEVWEWANSCHVLYRVTPYFEGDNLVAAGVLMEAKSVEKTGLEFCVFVYNVQPGIYIDYSDGSNHKEDEQDVDKKETDDENINYASNDQEDSYVAVTEYQEDDALKRSKAESDTSFVLNTNTRKFHRPTCKSVKEIREKNYMETTQTREEIINAGYSPCKRCNP